MTVKSKFIINIFDNQNINSNKKPKKKVVISKNPQILKPPQSLIDEFKVIKMIGKGRFGRVVSAQH